ncbi:MAG: GLUG motif-containing protein, partial [Bacteroidales bacterium]|nr:GLUG motif-containing protein [Bacteroidales bacterium]
MKKTIFRSLAIYTVVALVAMNFSFIKVDVANAVDHPFAGGNGTEGSPYQIATCEQLQAMKDYLNSDFILNNDIDCSDTVNWNDGAGFESISDGNNHNSENPFTGNFDGAGHVITDLYMNAPRAVGLFPWVLGGSISNVGLVNLEVRNDGSGSDVTGGLVGFLEDETVGEITRNGIIRNSFVTGVVFGGGGVVGGLVGLNGGSIYDSYSHADVSSNGADIGGFVGMNDDWYGLGIINNCYSTGNVHGSAEVGGFVGYHSSGEITDSYSTGDVSGSTSNQISGFAGANDDTLVNVYWYESENNSGLSCWTNWSDVGSDIGCTKVATTTGLTYFYDYNNAPMSMSDEGWDFDEVWSDWLNEVDYPKFQWEFFAGGDGSEETPYQISNCEQLQNMKYSLDSNYELINDIDCTESREWNLIDDLHGDGWVTDGGVSEFAITHKYIDESTLVVYVGGYGENYIVSSDDYTFVDGVIYFEVAVEDIWGVYADYNFYQGFEPIGTDEEYFSGSFDGDGYSIDGLLIDWNNDYIGLFGYGTGVIKNVDLTNVYVKGYSMVGALAGKLYGEASISGVNVSGTIIGSDNVGGLIGYLEGLSGDELALVENVSVISGNVIGMDANVNTGGLVGRTNEYTLISDSNASIDVVGHWGVGGLVGRSHGVISGSNATGNVTSDWGFGIGGLVGKMYGGEITQSYATGVVSSLGGTDVGIGYDVTSFAGGLVGYSSLGNINKSYATGDVFGTGYRVGGLVGGTSGTVENCYATGNVENKMEESFTEDNNRTGGLVGSLTGEVINSYALGDVSGFEFVGGLVGWSDNGSVSNSFSVGKVFGNDVYAGLVGYFSSSPVNLSNGAWNDDGTYPVGFGCYSYVDDEYVWGNENCETINNDLSHFYSASNVPMFENWNFETIWVETAGRYPTLLDISADDVEPIDNEEYYTLTYAAGTGGTLIGSTTQSVVSGTNGTAITAVPNSSYRFVRWSDNSTSNPRTDSNISGNISVSAIFERISSGGGSSPIILPPGVGDGARDASGAFNSVINIGEVTNSGVNALTYQGNQNNFTAPQSGQNWQLSNHSFKITNLDLYSNIVTLLIQSEPITLTLKKGESKEVDLDKDNTNDIIVTFTDVYVNRVEITVKSLKPESKEQVVVSPVNNLVCPSSLFTRDLRLGVSGNDVKALQQYLNNNNFKLANTGFGSPNNETSYFG